MSNQLVLPYDLHRRDWFVLMWDRDDRRYLLLLKDKSSYEVEDGDTGWRYLVNALNGDIELAERCLDTARNFVASACYPSLKEVFAIPEKFVKSRTESDLLFDEKNLQPWPELIAPPNLVLSDD